ncbi:hypothetical protein ABK040_002594 [Willaertia magna]
MSEQQQGKDSFSSPFLLSDEQIKQLGVKDHQIELYRRKHYQNCFSIETWINGNEDYTFYTKSLSLYFEEANAIVAAYKVNSKLYKITSLTEEQTTLLSGIEKRISECLNDQRFGNGAFLKLNTRSPKDVPWREYENDKFKRLVDIEMNKLTEKTPNNIYIAFLKAMNKSMKISTGKDAMYLLTNSQRVYEDLTKNVDFGKELYESKMILREWIDEVAENPQYEFRSFVHEKSLNAVSQYFCDNTFDELLNLENRKLIEKKIIDFFNNTVTSSITHPSFVIDFFVSPTRGVLIIELNPFHIGAGPCLFSWKGNEREILMNGPIEFRYQLEPATEKTFAQFLTVQWEKYLVLHHDIHSPNFSKEQLLEKQNSSSITTEDQQQSNCMIM